MSKKITGFGVSNGIRIGKAFLYMPNISNSSYRRLMKVKSQVKQSG